MRSLNLIKRSYTNQTKFRINYLVSKLEYANKFNKYDERRMFILYLQS